jgi:two-component system OmpR family response regulator
MIHPRAGQVEVLLVEDDDELRFAMAGCLSRAGYSVTLVATGTDAVRAARARRPDVMVIDLMLPDSGGLGVANEIRSEPALGAIPVLYTTGFDSPAVRERLAPAPVLFKPFNTGQLLTALRGTLGDAQPVAPPPAG